MEKSKILQSDVLDIIFDNRNKTYGAYELRKNYHKRAKKAVMIMALFAMLVVSAPLIASLLSDKEAKIKFEKPERNIPVVVPLEPVKPIQKKNTATPLVDESIVKKTPPVIVPPDEVNPDDVMKPAADPGKAGSTNHIGKDTGDHRITPPGTGPTPEPIAFEPGLPPEKIYDDIVVEQLPQFPGGEDALMAYLQSNIKYPKRALENDISGRVVLEFVVDKEGRITEIETKRKAGYGLDEEAKRVLGSMPDWKPGKINGNPVKVRLMIPIVFSLKEE